MTRGSALGDRVDLPDSTVFEQVGDAIIPWRIVSLEEDYRQLREEAALLDLSGAGLVGITGPDAESLLEQVFTRDVLYMTPERSATGLLLEDDGTPVDLVTLFRTDDGFTVETSVGCGRKALGFLQQRAPEGVEVSDASDKLVIVGIEGPKSIKVLGDLLVEPLEGLPYQGARTTVFGSSSVLVSRTGVTGEFGFKFLVSWDQVGELWAQLAAVAKPCGHEALETAMLEVRQPLLLREFLDDDCIESAGLNWLVDIQKPDFAGRDALLATLEEGAPARRVTIVVDGDVPPRTPVWLDGEAVGHIVLVRYSPTLAACCGIASMTSATAASGLSLTVGDTPEGGLGARTVSAPAVTPTSWQTLRG